MEDAAAAAPLIVLYLPPMRSHLEPMIELAKLLLNHHFSITVILPSPPTPAAASAASAAAPSSIRFHHLPPVPIPAGFPPPNDVASQFELIRLNNPNLRRALASFPAPPAAAILDFFCTPALPELQNIPTYFFYVSGAAALATLLSLPDINRKFPGGLVGVDVGLEVPGLPSLRSTDLPVTTVDRAQRSHGDFLEVSRAMSESQGGIVVNTFESLEPAAIEAIRAVKCGVSGGGRMTPRVYCVGPLLNLAAVGRNGDGGRHAALQWLDLQPSRSVVFLSFGSVGFTFSPEQTAEIAAALDRSGVRFLWVTRVPKSAEKSENPVGVETILPRGFLERTRDRGLVVDSWVPQVEILKHRSIGGFVTHCGWNSVLEAISAGVPMLGWPLYAEQKVNRVRLVGIGAALSVSPSVDGLVNSVELENRVIELMYSDKGKAIRERVLALKDDMAAAMNVGGSSVATLAQLALDMKNGKGKD